MLLATLLIMASATPSADQLLDRYRAVSSAQIKCPMASDNGDISVCALRRADQYRVPLIEYELGDPRAETVMQRTERMLNKTTPCQDRGPFLIGCGMVGVAASIGGRGTHIGGIRPLAP
jgi:hypothetical protein